MFHPRGPTFWELARQALSSTERGYDLLSRKFDFTPFRTPDIVLQTAAEHVGGVGPFRSLLDICCGTGAAMEAFGPYCSDLICGLDRSRGMLDVAKQHLASNRWKARIEFVRADVFEMPLDACFDVAVCFGALGHILPRDEALFVSQVWRILRPGGRFVCVTSELPPWWSLRRWVARSFNAAMHVRNLLVKPPFIMYYLTFLLPRAKSLLEQQGFHVEVHRGLYTGRLEPLRLVIATKPDRTADPVAPQRSWRPSTSRQDDSMPSAAPS